MGISVMGGIQPRRNEMQCSGNDKKGVMIYIEKTEFGSIMMQKNYGLK